MPKQTKKETTSQLDKLKQEVAEELHLDDDIAERGWENMTTREAGKIGGNMTKKMVGYAEENMGAKDKASK